MRAAFGVIVLLTLVVWLTYEYIAYKTPQAGDMISEIVWSKTNYPFFVFYISFHLGLLCGHFFWQRQP